MTTNDTGRSGGLLPRFTGKRTLRKFTGILAVCLAASLVAGYGDDKSEKSARRRETMLKIAARETEKSASGDWEYKKGLAAFDNGDHEKAAKLFRAGAEKGNSNAMVMLSYCKEEGLGTEQDDSAANLWMLKAADKGNPIAQAVCGAELMSVSEKRGLRYLRQSADQGCVLGQYFLGMLSLQKENAEEAVKYLGGAAGHPLTEEKDLLDYVMASGPDELTGMFGLETSTTNAFVIISQYLLGSAYMDGKGVEQDLDEAKKWLEMAKRNGMQDAEELVDRIDVLLSVKKSMDARDGEEKYMEGIAAFESGAFEEAVTFFRAGAEKGDAEAQMMLAYCLEEGIGTEEDEEESVEWMKKAADTGNPIAQALYGMHLSSELGDTEACLVYLKKSVDQDCVLGKLLLGGMLLRNKDEAEKGFEMLLKIAKLPPSDETSVLDYMKDEEDRELFTGRDFSAANAIIAMAQCLVGSAYIQGEGVERDPAEGEKWIRKAAAGGFVTAAELLEMIDGMKDADEAED